MAVVIENNCVDCQLPCINCGRKHQEVVKCDQGRCDNYASYNVDGEDYCDECLEDFLLKCFKELPIDEKIEVLANYVDVEQL
jgi:hypothetical protein